MNCDKQESVRDLWLDWLERLAMPVLEAAAVGELCERLPNQNPGRADTQSSEALARTLAGIAPYLERACGNRREQELRNKLSALARRAIKAEVLPESKAWSPSGEGLKGPEQPLVECAFLAEAILRAPNALYFQLDEGAQHNLIAVLQASRRIIATGNNWLLFSAMVEAALKKMGEQWEPLRVSYAINQFAQWYKGDSAYGDGEFLHFDYYNSFVIQPFLFEIYEECADEAQGHWLPFDEIKRRATRHAAVLERMIAPDGSWPVLGRSMAYRCGCFHLLALLAQKEHLPDSLPAAQVRCALTAAMKRSLNASTTFDADGWLMIGLCGDQPSLGEFYINNGSIYLCAQALLPLGLPLEADFWSQPDCPFTSARAWSGQDIPADKALHD